jgi:hypothetical protein
MLQPAEAKENAKAKQDSTPNHTDLFMSAKFVVFISYLPFIFMRELQNRFSAKFLFPAPNPWLVARRSHLVHQIHKT